MRLRTRLVGLLASLLLLGVVVGIPLLLAAVSTDLIPTTLPTIEQIRTALSAPDDGTLALRAVVVVAWAAWDRLPPA